MKLRLVWLFPVGLVSVLSSASATFAQYGDEYEHEPINYSKTTPINAVSSLQRKIDQGLWSADAGNDKRFLTAVLDALAVPVESQVLVFSKTSHQNPLITPQTPRAVYFSDSCYVGWVQGGAIEVACTDPRLGPVFYVLNFRTTKPPRFERTESCLSCHGGSNTRYTPGLMVRSVYTDRSGFPILSEGSHLTTHRSPLEERWGGWYVTGQHGRQRHMGNAIAKRDGRRVTLDMEKGANLTSLDSLFRVAPYLTGTSDIVALMVLEHQAGMHNALTRANHKTRQAIYRQRDIQRTFGEPPSDKLEGSALRIVTSEAGRVVEQLLFCEEAPLSEPIKGGRAFPEAFLRQGKRTRGGLSLRDFDLRTRLFANRCSYMVYSLSFDALPVKVKDLVYAKLWDVLTGRDTSEKFEHLGQAERASILKILRETKSDLPESWKQS